MSDALLILVGGILIVTFVLNAAVRLNQSRMLPPDAGNELFRQTTRGWGGADFIGASAVAVISFVAPVIVFLASLPDARLPRPAPGWHLTLNWRVAVPVMVVSLALNWVIIRLRHKALLDWMWAGLAAATILCGSSTLWYLLLPR
jgi:hypothetical protein